MRMRLVVAAMTCGLAGACDGGGARPDASPPPIDAADPDARPPIDAADPDARPPIDAPPSSVLTVMTIGTGTVRSTPAGIECPFACTAPFQHGTEVTLTATAPMGVTFTGWQGSCSGTGDCVITIDGPATAIASFSGVPCQDACTAGQSECTTPTRERNCGQFDADVCLDWSPEVACMGSDQCRMGHCGGAHRLSVLPLPEGMTPADVGTVASVPSGILCGRDGNDCQEHYDHDASVTLTASSDATAMFYGWSLVPLAGDNGMHCVGLTSPCTVMITEETALAALYCSPECAAGTARCTGLDVAETCGEHDDDPCLEVGAPVTCPANQLCTPGGCAAGFVVSATIGGPGTGTVAIDGVPCTQFPCSRGVATGGTATVTATPAPYSLFTGWSGACTGMGPCVLSAPGTATANFAKRCNETTTSTQGSVYAFGQGADTLYWTRVINATYSIAKMPKTGGAPTQVTLATTTTLVVDEPDLYWMRNLGNDVHGIMRFTGGVATQVVSDASWGLPAVNATDLFYRKAGTLQRMPKAGGMSTQLAAGLPGALNQFMRLMADADRAYWFGDGSVIAVPIAGGAPVTLATNQGPMGVAAQDATYLYWVRGGTEVVRVAKAGGMIELLATTTGAVDVAVLGNTLVWYGSRAYATTIGSGVIQQLIAPQAFGTGSSLAMDASAIYLVGHPPVGGDVIMTLPRTATCAPP